MVDGWDFLPAFNIFAAYLVYNLCLLPVKLSMQRFKGSSVVAGFLLSLLGFVGMCFGYGYVVYYGYLISWQSALTLLVVGYLFTTFISTTILAALTAMKPHLLFVFGYAGFITLPIIGYLMISQLLSN